MRRNCKVCSRRKIPPVEAKILAKRYNVLQINVSKLFVVIVQFLRKGMWMGSSVQMPEGWLEVSIRKVLRPAISTQVFLGFPLY